MSRARGSSRRSRPRFGIRAGLALSVLAAVSAPRLAGPLPPARSLEAAEPPSSIRELAEALLSRAEELEGPEFWRAVRKVEAMGNEVEPLVLQGLSSPVEGRVLACAALAYRIGGEATRMAATRALSSLARSTAPVGTRASAIHLLGQNGDPEAVQPVLEDLLEGSLDAGVLIPAAVELWDLDRVKGARDKLVDLVGSTDPSVRQEAALALAEMDWFEGDVREVLRTLKDEPSELGRRARSLAKVDALSRQIDSGIHGGAKLPDGVDPSKLLEIREQRIRELEEEIEQKTEAARRPPPSRDSADSVIDEVIRIVREAYVDESKTDRRSLIIDALKGMVGGLDEFSAFMDPDENRTFHQSLSGEYFGIGAQVHKAQGSPLEILKPIYGGPAYRVGLLSGDLILEVDGVSTSEHELQEIIDRLKGPDATKVRLKVLRRGWSEPRDFEVERRMVEVPSVYAQMLPGKIGYLHILQFGEKSADEFTRELDALEKDGMEALVIDLRNDPGGRLDAAVQIVDQFVDEKETRPIVTQKGRQDGDPTQQISTYPTPFKRPGYPLVALVNERSASASEIVAGALQDFGRATVVGKRTFGKGSVQRLIPLSPDAEKALGGEAQLRLTVQYYFLPLDRCIHTIRDKDGVVVQPGGVQPDVEVDAEQIPMWRFEERERLRNHEAVRSYVDRHWEELRKLYLGGDGRDPARYPELPALGEAVATTAPADDLRLVIRGLARRRIEDQNGKEFACEFQDDVQLQAAIRTLLGALDRKPEEIPEYAALKIAEPPKVETPKAEAAEAPEREDGGR